MKRPAEEGNPPSKAKSRKVEVVCTAYKATCIRQSLGKSVSSEWKAAINADIERIGTIVWLGSRAFLHYLTTSVATGKTTLPCDDNGLNRLIKAALPSTAMVPLRLPLERLRRSSNGVPCGRLKSHLTYRNSAPFCATDGREQTFENI